MLEKPDLRDDAVIGCLQSAYGLYTADLTFLPIGNDVDTVVYRAVTTEGTPYFVKLRRGAFNRIGVDVPDFLHRQGVAGVIAPLASAAGAVVVELEGYHMVLYPFVEGQDGFAVALSEAQWEAFGRTLRQIHNLPIPPELAARIPRETYSDDWRARVRQFQAHAATETFQEPVAAALAALLRDKQRVIDHLIGRAAALGAVLMTQAGPPVLCHSDIHVGNLLINASALYIVDWDQPILAPKERDLMFIGSGIGGGADPEQDTALFYAGYGPVTVDQVALAYYRYERIVEDIAAYCAQLLLTDAGGADRAEGLRQLSGQFLPGDVIDMAYRAERQLPAALQQPLD